MANGTIAVSQLEILTQSGTGIITVVPPATNTNRTLTLPDATGTVATAESTLSQFNASGSAPVYAARAWVNFNGTGTVAIRGSGNVSSITDNGVGQYTVNFTTAMSDANYCATSTANPNGYLGAYAGTSDQGFLAGSFRVDIRDADNTNTDSNYVFCSVFR